MIKKGLLFISLLLLCCNIFAHNKPCPKCKCHNHHCKKINHKSYWKGSNAQIGYVKNTGNTSNSMLNLGTNIQFAKKRWNNLFQGQYQYGKTDGITNRNYGHLYDQLQYSLNDHKKRDNYLFANSDVQFTKFGPYSYQSVYAAGYGRDWINRKHFTLSAQVGPGYRRNKTGDGKIQDDFVATAQAVATLLLSKYGTLSETYRYDYAKSYTYTHSVTAFTNKIIGNLAVQLSYTIDHYSKIPPSSSNTKKTDTQTNISLVYNFVQ